MVPLGFTDMCLRNSTVSLEHQQKGGAVWILSSDTAENLSAYVCILFLGV